MKRSFLNNGGFSLAEFLIATFIIVFTAASGYYFLGSISRFTGHRTHRDEASGYAAQTLDILRNYVTQDTTDSQYHLEGDDPPSGARCTGGGVGRYALRPLSDDLPEGMGHCHPLPEGSGTLRTTYGGWRTFEVKDEDLNGDGVIDFKRVTVYVHWDEPQ